MISIVIPTLMDAVWVVGAVQSIVTHCGNADLPFEIIIGIHDDDDQQFNLLSDMAEDYRDGGTDITLLSLDHCPTVAAVRNTAASYAHGDVLAFLDADCEITKPWADTLVERTRDGSNEPLKFGHIYGRRVFAESNASWVYRAWQQPLDARAESLGFGGYLGTANMIMLHDTFQAIGGFNTNLATGEDVEFCNRAKSVVHDRGLMVQHTRTPRTLTAFFQREVWHGVGDWLNWRTALYSPVAVVAFVITFLLVAGLVALFLKPEVSLAALATLVVLTLFLTVGRFPHYRFTLIERLQCMFLNLIYCVARVVSVIFRKEKARLYDYEFELTT